MVLFIDCCIRECSRTKELAEYLLKKTGKEVKRVSPYDENLRPLDKNALLQREAEIPDLKAVKQAKDLSKADKIVIAAPFWDLSFPSALKIYLENVSVPGITFKYNEYGAPVGLCRAKELYYVTTSGGIIYDDSFGFGYVKALFSMFGIKNAVMFKAENLDVDNADVKKILDDAKNEIDGYIKKSAVC